LTSQGKVTNLQFYLVLFYAFVGFVILSSTYTEVFSVNKILASIEGNFSFVFFFIFFYFITGGFLTL